MGEQAREDHGALVGWKAQSIGDNLVLQIQSLTRDTRDAQGEPRCFDYVLNRNQAVQLGNFLFEITGQTAPKRRRSLFSRRRGARSAP